jgi:hypothetical protein
VEEATWLSSIVVVPKKNGKLQICVDFWKLNVTMKKGSLSFTFNGGSTGHGGKAWGLLIFGWLF